MAYKGKTNWQNNEIVEALDMNRIEQGIIDNESGLTSHKNNTLNPHKVTKSQVGLGNVDNTSDKNKPISTAQQAALDLKANKDLSNVTNMDFLATAPAIEELKDADLDFLEAWRASSHLIDPAKDLITEAGTLYRLTHVIEDGNPWLKHKEVGKSILNGGMDLTAPGDAPRMRLYWKAQGERSEANAYITAWAGENQENRYAGEIDSYTRQYSAVFDLSASRTVTLSTLTAWGQEVKIWDFDWRVE